MYLPARFAETRIEALHALIDAYPLGALVRAGAGGLDADHLPFQLVAPCPGAPYGRLRAHVARANPLWRLGEGAGGLDVLVLFRGAAGYVSPREYDLDAVGGREVPTWNYAVVHAHGKMRTVDDPDWIIAHMHAATLRREGAPPDGWAIADAPRDYIGKLLRATVGIEIEIARIEGKFKAG